MLRKLARQVHFSVYILRTVCNRLITIVVWSYFAEGATTTIDGKSDDVGLFPLRLPFSFAEVTCVSNTMPSLMVNKWYTSLPKSPLERIHLSNVPCVLSTFAPVLADNTFALVLPFLLRVFGSFIFLENRIFQAPAEPRRTMNWLCAIKDRNHDNFCRARSEYE
jgi:hypothetical protein